MNKHEMINKICNSNKLSRKDYINLKKYIYENEETLRHEFPIVPFDINDDKVIIISDCHYFSISENRKLMDEVYEFAKKHGINTIINLGDLVQGTSGKDKTQKEYINEPLKQYEELLKVYPRDRYIENKILLGNHDVSPIYIEDGLTAIQIVKLLENRRDFEVVGLKAAWANWYNNCDYVNILFKHQVQSVDLTHEIEYPIDYTFYGHNHRYHVVNNRIKVPSISKEVKQGAGILNPGFLVVSLIDEGIKIDSYNKNNAITLHTEKVLKKKRS